MLYVVLDLETTGFSRSNCHIIELAAEILAPNGVAMEDSVFSSLIKPPQPIPSIVVELTGITQEMVETQHTFKEVIETFFDFLLERVQTYEETSPQQMEHIVFVGHNSK